jgi:hypothetical protein
MAAQEKRDILVQAQHDEALVAHLKRRLLDVAASGDNHVNAKDWSSWIWEDSLATRSERDFLARDSALFRFLCAEVKGVVTGRSVRILAVRLRKGGLMMDIESVPRVRASKHV